MLDGTYHLKHNGQNIFQMARIKTFTESIIYPTKMLMPIRKKIP